ncbi:MAG: hypothetical protein J6S85_23080 [Methanobrevibacter sp.]|nr:hypothetical protein [Methanobrevibacter sp.]
MDIESHNDEESIEKKETSMWLGCFINEESKWFEDSSYFYDMDEFLNRLKNLSSRKRKKVKGKLQKRPCINICVYVYNLSFEYSFLLPYMLKWGFKHKDKIGEEDEMVFNSITTKSVSSVWQVQMKFGKNDGIVLLRDLAKIYGGGLGQVAKAFNLPTQKGEIDYRLNRLHNYTIKCYEKIYCFKDTRIIIDILLKEIEMDDKEFFKAVSMASYSVSRLIKCGYPRSTKPYGSFRKEYPFLDEEEATFVRNALSGGICYATREWQFVDIKQPILHIDAHQMYPSQVVLKPHPYGYGEYFKGAPTKFFKKINCCHIRLSYNDVIIHSVIKLIGRSFGDNIELYLFDFEIATMMKCYVDLEIEYIDGYCYDIKFLPWRNEVKENYKRRLEAKKNKDSYNTLRYKLINNSGAYGKFVERPHNQTFVNCINQLGIIDSVVEDKKEIEVNAKYTYIPLATIPAYGRVCLIENALKFLWDDSTQSYSRRDVLYFDTDSIFVLWNEHTKQVWETEFNQKDELGGWAVEDGGLINRAQFTAPKRYKLEVIQEDKPITTIKSGGINYDFYKEANNKELIEEYMKRGMTRKEALGEIIIPYDEVNIISSSWRVQRAYRVKGGTIIEFQEKEMNVQKKYIDIYEKNMKK